MHPLPSLTLGGHKYPSGPYIGLIPSFPISTSTSTVGDLDVFSIRSLVHMIKIYFTCVSLILNFFKYSGSVAEAPSGKVLSSELKILQNKKVVYVYFPIDAQNIHVTDPGFKNKN